MLAYGDWGTAYGPRGSLTVPKSGLSPATEGWLFWVEDRNQDKQKILAQWFGVMAERLGAKADSGVKAVPIPTPEPAAMADPETPGRPAPTPVVVKRADVPVPVIQEAEYIAGNKLQLKWAALGQGFSYVIFRARIIKNPQFLPLIEGRKVSTPGAIIDINAFTERI